MTTLFFPLATTDMTQPLVGSKMDLQALYPPYFSGSASQPTASYGHTSSYSGTDGVEWFYNLAPGTYRIKWTNANKNNPLIYVPGMVDPVEYIQVNETNGQTINGWSCVIVPTGSTGIAGQVAYSTVASDARYVRGTNGTASYASTASYTLNSGSVTNAISSSYSLTASYAINGGGTSLITGSTYQITSSQAISASYAPSSPSISASYASTSSYSKQLTIGELNVIPNTKFYDYGSGFYFELNDNPDYSLSQSTFRVVDNANDGGSVGYLNQLFVLGQGGGTVRCPYNDFDFDMSPSSSFWVGQLIDNGDDTTRPGPAFAVKYGSGSFDGDVNFNGSLKYNNLPYTASKAISSSYALTASFAMNGGGGTGSNYPDITDDTVNHQIGINQTSPQYSMDISGTFNASGYGSSITLDNAGPNISIDASDNVFIDGEGQGNTYGFICLNSLHPNGVVGIRNLFPDGRYAVDISGSINITDKVYRNGVEYVPSSASYASTASYVINSGSVTNAISSSYSLTASFALNGGGGGTTLTTASTYPITSSWAVSASYVSNNNQIQTYYDTDSSQYYGLTVNGISGSEYISIVPMTYNSQSGILSNISSSYASTASYTLNSQFVDADLQGWWKFDNITGSNITDYSNYRRHGLILGSGYSWITNSYVGSNSSALSLTTGSWVSLGTKIHMLGDISLCIWVNKISTDGNYPGFLGAYIQNSSGILIFLDPETSKAFLQVADANSNISFASTNTGITGAWHHLVATVDRTQNIILMYMDGVLQSASSSIASVGFNESTTYWVINSRYDSDYNHHGTMYVDDARVYSKVLSQSDVTALYLAGPA